MTGEQTAGEGGVVRGALPGPNPDVEPIILTTSMRHSLSISTAPSREFREYRILPERQAEAVRRKMLRRLFQTLNKGAVEMSEGQQMRAPKP